MEPRTQELPPLPETQQLDQVYAMSAPPPVEGTSKGKRFWRKFGGDGFLISVGFHIALFIILLTLAITHVVTKEPDPSAFITGAGGGNSGDKVSMNEHRVKPKASRSLTKSTTKLVAKGASSSISLPEMPSMNSMFAETGSLLGASSKGIGGGAGSGEGGGIGPGVGRGKNMVSLFGTRGFKRPNALEGTLYDLKRDRNGRKLHDFGDQRKRIAEMQKAYTGFVKSGMQKSFFDTRYTAAPDKLYATHMLIPPVNANQATKAFGCEDKIEAPGWLGYYEGAITPPETDDYRFVGMGDDGLLITLDSKTVLWAPWTQGGMQTWVRAQKDWEPKFAYTPAGRLPNLATNGRYHGSWVNLRKGQTYKMQIVIAEGYGGLFSASILMQQKSKVPDANPSLELPLPVFMLAPLGEEELKQKQGMRMRWTEKGPVFGLELNGVRGRRLDGR